MTHYLPKKFKISEFYKTILNELEYRDFGKCDLKLLLTNNLKSFLELLLRLLSASFLFLISKMKLLLHSNM